MGKAREQLWKESKIFRQKFRRSKDAVKLFSAITWKVQTRKPTGGPVKLSSQFKRRIVHEVKMKTSPTSKILKSLVDAPCSARTIRRHLNNEKIKHKKRIHRPRLTMKHKGKRLDYSRQYQTISVKEWWKVVFSDEKKFNLDGPDGFQKYWHTKKISRRELLNKT